MQKPMWKERLFEGRQVRIRAISEEREVLTSFGTRWPVYARVEVGSGMWEGTVYESVPIFSPRLKAQLLASSSVEGRLCRGPALHGAPVQWVVKES